MSAGALDKTQILERLTETLTRVPNGVKIRKLEFGLDAEGNTAEIRYYDSDDNLIFTLTFSNAGSIVSTWNVTRT